MGKLLYISLGLLLIVVLDGILWWQTWWEFPHEDKDIVTSILIKFLPIFFLIVTLVYLYFHYKFKARYLFEE